MAQDANLRTTGDYYTAGFTTEAGGDGEDVHPQPGPQHPATHGVLRVVVELDGEYIRRAEPVLGYIHRMHEKMGEVKTYPQYLPNMGRVDYLHALAWNWAYVGAVEKLMGIRVPERAEYIRVITCELNRISSHLLWWGAYLLDLGAFTPIVYAPIPFSPMLTGMDVNLGLLLVLAFSGLNTLALCLAGWGSNNKYSLLGAARALAQSVAYEIPLLLSVLAVAFQCGSLSLSVIAAGQTNHIWSWNVFVQPLAFVIFFIAAVAETNRAPFDLPEAESELTAGFHAEYAGMGFGIFFLAEYSYMVVVSAVATALFLGGWDGPVFPGPWWFLAKTFALVLAMMWFRWTFPRVRFDQLLNICWKWLIPLGLANLVATALVVKLVS